MLLKQCRDADYSCYLVHEESEVIQNCTEKHHQVVVLVDVQATTSLPGASSPYNNLESLSK